MRIIICLCVYQAVRAFYDAKSGSSSPCEAIGCRVHPKDCLVLSRAWGNGLLGTIIGDYIEATIGIHSPIPY